MTVWNFVLFKIGHVFRIFNICFANNSHFPDNLKFSSDSSTSCSSLEKQNLSWYINICVECILPTILDPCTLIYMHLRALFCDHATPSVRAVFCVACMHLEYVHHAVLGGGEVLADIVTLGSYVNWYVNSVLQFSFFVLHREFQI